MFRCLCLERNVGGLHKMGTIICQGCGQVIEHFESNQVKTLYGVCQDDCKHDNSSKQK